MWPRARTLTILTATSLLFAGGSAAFANTTSAGSVTTNSPGIVVKPAFDCPAHGGVPGGISRTDVLARASRWFSPEVQYSQSACHSDGSEGQYRTDCSGYVSMAWGLSSSVTTDSFLTNSSLRTQLNSWSDLKPGDAVVRPARSGQTAHVVLFVAWANSSKTAMRDWEQNGTANDMMDQVRTVTSLQTAGAIPIRYTQIKETPTTGEGSFISYDNHVYRIAGGAPVYVSSWDNMGGSQPVQAVTKTYFDSLRTYPSDGTFINGAKSGYVYRIAGGAPVYVTTWDAFGGPKPTVSVDQAAIDGAGGDGAFSHLRLYPRNATFVTGAQTGYVYSMAAGAPIYVANWAAFGGEQPTITVDQGAIDRAGTSGDKRFEHMRFYPIEGAFIEAAQNGKVYQVTNGVASLVPTGTQSRTKVDQTAIDRAGQARPYDHLRGVQN